MDNRVDLTLRMDLTAEAGALFGSLPRRKDKALLLDISIVSPCISSNLDNAACCAGKKLADAVERWNNKYRGLSSVTYYYPPSSCSVDVW